MTMNNKDTAPKLRTENPFEQQIEVALIRAGESYTSDHDGTNASHLDFCLTNRDIHIEVKTMHSDRVAEQMSRVSDVIVAQGQRAIAYLASLIARVDPPAAPAYGPCSACGDGDTDMKYHSHGKGSRSNAKGLPADSHRSLRAGTVETPSVAVPPAPADNRYNNGGLPPLDFSKAFIPVAPKPSPPAPDEADKAAEDKVILLNTALARIAEVAAAGERSSTGDAAERFKWIRERATTTSTDNKQT